jgi:hypothetical protein
MDLEGSESRVTQVAGDHVERTVVQPPWPWLPTEDGAIRRESVLSVHVERHDGSVRDGAETVWRVFVRTSHGGVPVLLRPTFPEPGLLRWWMDRVFPGACFEILPPDAVVGPGGENSENLRPLSVPPGIGSRVATQIRQIGEGLMGGDAYTPPQGYRPPPGTHVAI